MNRLGRAAMMLSLAGIMTRLLWSGTFGSFVQQRMKWPLIAATVVLFVFGIYEAIGGAREENEDAESSRRSVGPTVGWLMLLPLLVLVSVAPTALGAAAADRVDAYAPTEVGRSFEPLEAPATGALEMRVIDFLDRAFWDSAQSLDGVPIRLEGLVVNDAEITDGFKLTRFMVSCCAADGIPLQVTIRGVNQPLENDTWVIADVMWRVPEVPYAETTGVWVVEADALQITETEAPNDPYESPY